jgi:predicted dithiol-disulfide oxidoreductase (DUF899 family)
VPDQQTRERLHELEAQVTHLRRQMQDLRRALPPEPVADYVFATLDGTVRLSELFAGKADLFVIHNMGRNCPYCTLWADELNGFLPHVESRAALAVASPDDPATQRAFALARGWRFRMVSYQGNSFAADMGYHDEQGFRPGVSVFRRAGEAILRVADTGFAPHDDYCALWHLFDLLPEGAAGWKPQFAYV